MIGGRSIRNICRSYLAPFPRLYRPAQRIYHLPTTLPRTALSRILPSEKAVLTNFATRQPEQVYFIQIGAHDGMTGDDLRPFILHHGWRGVLVEPVATIFAQLKQNYLNVPGLTFVNAAIAEMDGECSFWRARDDAAPASISQLASLRRDVIETHVPGTDQQFVEERVPCMTFTTLLVSAPMPRVDLIVIDTEGYDYKILRQINFASVRPSMILYEQRHLPADEKLAARRLLKRYGYHVRRIGEGLNNAAMLL